MSLVCLPAEKLNELYNQLNGLRRAVCLNALDMNEYVVPIPVIEVEKIVYVDRFVDVSGAPVSVDISGSPETSFKLIDMQAHDISGSLKISFTFIFRPMRLQGPLGPSFKFICSLLD